MFCLTSTRALTRSSPPIEMSQRASSAQASSALPMCADGGPRRGAGRLKSVSKVWPARERRGQRGLSEGQLVDVRAVDLDPLLAADDLALAVALLARLLVLLEQHAHEPDVGAARVDVLARCQSQVTGDRVTNAHRILDRDLAVEPVAWRHGQAQPGRSAASGWLPLGPAKRWPSTASNGAGELPKWPTA